MRNVYLLAAFIGTIIPWYFFANFFMVEGLNLPLFLSHLVANWVASGAQADLLISFAVFAIWSFYDARSKNIRHWWLIFPMAFLVGFSLALPFYLYQREGALSKQTI